MSHFNEAVWKETHWTKFRIDSFDQSVERAVKYIDMIQLQH